MAMVERRACAGINVAQTEAGGMAEGSGRESGGGHARQTAENATGEASARFAAIGSAVL